MPCFVALQSLPDGDARACLPAAALHAAASKIC
jgi:hypothetical protein